MIVYYLDNMLGKKNLNKSFIILVLISIIVFSAGCISSDPNSDKYVSNDSVYNSSPNDFTNSNNGSENSNLNSNDKPAHYDKKGYCNYVVDGDTINVEGVGRIRFVGVNTPERGQAGYQEAKDFVKSYCLDKTVYLDVDDAKNHDKYGRTLAVVYVGKTNLNALLLQKGYAEVMYIPPSEFNPYSWT